MRSPRNLPVRCAVVAVAGALVLAGCSAGDAGDGSGDADITTTTTEYAFTPDAWTVTAGEFSIELVNEALLEHDWTVIALGEDIESEDELFGADIFLLQVEAIDAGTSTTESFTIDEPGTYQVICSISGHFNEGMEGTLTVE